MITTAGWQWLEKLLRQRLDLDGLKLEEADGAIQLLAPGMEGVLRFTATSTHFGRSNGGIPCGSWQPDADGWQFPFDSPLPMPGMSAPITPVVMLDGVNATINYDVPTLCFWALCRLEEINPATVDEHDRFPATASHAAQHGYLERPIVDEWLWVVGLVLERIWPGYHMPLRQFKILPSHDVDRPSRYAFRSLPRLLRNMAGNVLLRGDLRGSLLAPKVWLGSSRQLHPQDPYNTFDWIMDRSGEHGLTSIFHFICNRRHPTYDADYKLQDEAILHLMRRIHARGHLIGVHPGYATHNDAASLTEDVAKLRLACYDQAIPLDTMISRMHYLRWSHPATLRACEQAQVDIDGTLGYADRPGFRCGTCFDYPAFDADADRLLDLTIRPLIAMECSVTDPSYMNLGFGDAAFDVFARLKDRCRQVGGQFTLLWHNSELHSAPQRALYRRILDH